MRRRTLYLPFCLSAALIGAGCDSEPKLKVERAKAPTAASGTASAAPETVAPSHAQTSAPPIPPGAQLPAGHPPLTAPAGGQEGGGVRLPIVAPGGEGGNAVVWTVPAGWTQEPPANPTRRAQYRVPGKAGDGEFLVFYFGPGQGGDAASNVERWAAQFEPESGKSAAKKTRTLTAGGMKVLVIETAGTYLAGSMIGGQVERKPGWALLGAVVEGPDANWYFKFTGPKGTVDAQRSAFDGLLKSLKRGG